MISEECKKMARELVKKAQEKGLITKYSDWCKTEEAKEYAVEEKPEWQELCEICSSLAEEANITKEDIRRILKEVREKYNL